MAVWGGCVSWLWQFPICIFLFFVKRISYQWKSLRKKDHPRNTCFCTCMFPHFSRCFCLRKISFAFGCCFIIYDIFILNLIHISAKCRSTTCKVTELKPWLFINSTNALPNKPMSYNSIPMTITHDQDSKH